MFDFLPGVRSERLPGQSGRVFDRSIAPVLQQGFSRMSAWRVHIRLGSVVAVVAAPVLAVDGTGISGAAAGSLSVLVTAASASSVRYTRIRLR